MLNDDFAVVIILIPISFLTCHPAYCSPLFSVRDGREFDTKGDLGKGIGIGIDLQQVEAVVLERVRQRRRERIHVQDQNGFVGVPWLPKDVDISDIRLWVAVRRHETWCVQMICHVVLLFVGKLRETCCIYIFSMHQAFTLSSKAIALFTRIYRALKSIYREEPLRNCIVNRTGLRLRLPHALSAYVTKFAWR